MTYYIVTDFANPINVGSFHGSITNLELKVWPGLKPHSGGIATLEVSAVLAVKPERQALTFNSPEALILAGTTTNSLVLQITPSDPLSDIKFAAPIQTRLRQGKRR